MFGLTRYRKAHDFVPSFDDFFSVDLDYLFPTRIVAPRIVSEDRKDSIVYSMELPGVSKENIEVRVQDGLLIIQGEKDGCKLTESRSLPMGSKPEDVSAKLKDGVLQVLVKKHEPTYKVVKIE